MYCPDRATYPDLWPAQDETGHLRTYEGSPVPMNVARRITDAVDRGIAGGFWERRQALKRAALWAWEWAKRDARARELAVYLEGYMHGVNA